MRTYKFLLNILAGFVLMIGVTSCEDYLDVNTDKNNPTSKTVIPTLVLPVGQHYTAHYLHAFGGANALGNLFMYNWGVSYGFSWYNDEFNYLVSTTFYDQLFEWAYFRPLKQYHILTQDERPEWKNYVAIGKIMKAYHFQMLVDIYGDVPYTEALGRNTEPTPKYDNAEAIYNDLLVQLTEAITLIDEAAENAASEEPEGDDAMFGGDMVKWKQFANTVKLRILTRVSGEASFQSTITSELAAIQAEGSGFITDDVIIGLGYQQEENKQNPYWEDFGASVDGTPTLTYKATAATQYILDYLIGNGDPRVDYIYEEPADGHNGVTQGVKSTIDKDPALVSNLGPGILRGPDMGSNIYTEAEMHFNLAELALKGFSTGATAEQHYNAGIVASFEYLGLSAADAEDYYDRDGNGPNNVDYNASTNKLEAIITQKWIAVNSITAEQSWFDHSRTGFPANLPLSTLASKPNRPVRLAYPASESSTNAENMPNRPDPFTNKIFWAN